ncbi:MAG: MBG domain-containing protein, partial [Candidatus Coproplasma sp.]
YGVPLTDSGAVLSGFVNDETDSVLGGELSYFFANSYSTVGTYSGCVKISGLTSDNYDITFVPGDLTITQRAIVVIWQNATNLTYNGKEQNVWPGINNRVPGDDVLAVVTGGNAIDAGNYTATVTGLTGNDAGNYKITETISKDYTIAKEKVSITPISYSVTYGDAEEQLYANVEGTIYNDDFTYEINRVSGTSVNVYTITVSVTGNTQNYELSTYTGTYTITKRMVSLTWNAPADLVYNGLEKAVTVDVHNFIEGDDVTVIAANCNQTNAGSYTATASLSGSKAGNYEIYSTQTSFSYTIDQRPLTLTWNVPADLTYNAQNKTVTATLNNVVDGDSVSVIITNGSLRDAGSYTAIAALSGTDAKNYKLSGSTTQNYIISPAKVTISANNATTVYGELIPKLTASISGTIYNDELIWSVNTSANDIVPAPAGSYEITVEVVANPNYSVTTVNGTYTVTKATPILKGITGGVYTVSEEAEYGTTLEEISSKLPAQTLEGTWTWTDGNDKVAEAGTNIYEVKFVPSDSDNFNSVTVSVTITVKAADPVIEG